MTHTENPRTPTGVPEGVREPSGGPQSAPQASGGPEPARGAPGAADGRTAAPGLTIRAIQSAAWQNKIAKGFNTTDVPLEFGLLTGELGEAFTAWHKSLPDFGEELADVFLYLVAIAEMTGVDLQAEVENKHAKNQARTYRRAANGVLIKTEGVTA
jgi:NTP pyrophosphatase (non-canonical NTP hydrolase)